MGNSQSYNLSQAEHSVKEKRRPSDEGVPSDAPCRTISVLSTASIRKVGKKRERQEKENSEKEQNEQEKDNNLVTVIKIPGEKLKTVEINEEILVRAEELGPSPLTEKNQYQEREESPKKQTVVVEREVAQDTRESSDNERAVRQERHVYAHRTQESPDTQRVSHEEGHVYTGRSEESPEMQRIVMKERRIYAQRSEESAEMVTSSREERHVYTNTTEEGPERQRVFAMEQRSALPHYSGESPEKESDFELLEKSIDLEKSGIVQRPATDMGVVYESSKVGQPADQTTLSIDDVRDEVERSEEIPTMVMEGQSQTTRELEQPVDLGRDADISEMETEHRPIHIFKLHRSIPMPVLNLDAAPSQEKYDKLPC